MKPQLRVLALASACLFLAFPVHATVDTANLSRARRLFDEGAALQARQQWGEAAAKYRQAAAIKDTPGLRFRAGYCEARRQRLLEAALELERARELLDADPSARDVQALLPEAIAKLERRIPKLTVKLAEPTQVSVFAVDSKRLAPQRLGESLRLNPGKHFVTLRTTSGRSYSRQVTLGESEQLTLEARFAQPDPIPVPLASGLASRTDNARDREPEGNVRWRSGVLLAGTGLAAAGLAAGASYAWAGRRAQERYQGHVAELDDGACREPSAGSSAACAGLRRALTDRQRSQRRARLGFAAAGAGAAIALTTVWLGLDSKVTTSATITPKGAAFFVRGSL